jgi:hypothetical protein
MYYSVVVADFHHCENESGPVYTFPLPDSTTLSFVKKGCWRTNTARKDFFSLPIPVCLHWAPPVECVGSQNPAPAVYMVAHHQACEH